LAGNKNGSEMVGEVLTLVRGALKYSKIP